MKMCRKFSNGDNLKDPTDFLLIYKKYCFWNYYLSNVDFQTTAACALHIVQGGQTMVDYIAKVGAGGTVCSV